MTLFLAIDAGGTKTDYVLANETHILARVRSGTIKRMRTDAITATANLEAALRDLTMASGHSLQSITRTRIGTAGNTVPLVADFLREQLTARVSGNLILVGDVEIASMPPSRAVPAYLSSPAPPPISPRACPTPPSPPPAAGAPRSPIRVQAIAPATRHSAPSFSPTTKAAPPISWPPSPPSGSSTPPTPSITSSTSPTASSPRLFPAHRDRPPMRHQR